VTGARGKATRSRSTKPVIAGFGALGLFWGAWASLLPSVQRATGATKSELGVALLCVAVGSIPSTLVAGWLIDHVGAAVVPASIWAFGVAVMLPGLAGSVPVLALTLVAAGATSGAMDVAVNARVAAIEVETGKRRMHLAHAVYSVGVVAGAISAGLARQAGASREQILIVVGAAIVLIGVANHGRGPSGSRGEAKLRFTRALAVLGVVALVAFVVEGGLESWSALFLERDLAASPAVSALGPGLFALTMALGRGTGQLVGGALGERRLLGLGALAASAGAGLAAASHATALALAGFALAGGGISVAAPILFGAAGRGLPGTQQGSAVGTVTTIGYVGFLVGPALMGAVSGAAGLRAGLVMLAGAALLLALGSRRV
jgi:MFS family permease